MADINELANALKNAHDAGDTVAATALANAISDMQTAQASGAPSDIQNAVGSSARADEKPFYPVHSKGFEMGLTDPLYGGAQFGLHVLPEAARPGFIPSASQFDTTVSNRENEYQTGRKNAGETGLDAPRLTGNLIGTAPLMLATPTAPTSLMGSTLTGAGSGFANAALMPETGPGPYWGNKGMHLAVGTGTGAATGLVGGLLSGPAKAAGDDVYGQSVQRLQARGVDPTVGQIAGHTAAKVEDIAHPVSVFGQQRAVQQVNTAALESVVAPLSAVDPKLTEIGSVYGRKGLSAVYDNLKAAYDKLLPNVGVKVDGQFNQGLQDAAQEIAFTSPAIKEHYQDILTNQILTRIDQNGEMSGPAFKALEEELSKQIGRLQPRGGDEAALADAFDKVLDTFRDNLARNNPQFGPQLQAVNQSYARFADVRRAVANSKNADGIFSPAQLLAALKSGDTSAGKYITAEGKGGDLQELALDAVRVLGTHYPQSGTVPRAIAASLLAGGGAATAAAHPVGVAALGASSLAYTPWGQRAISAIATPRAGQVLPLMGGIVKGAAPLLSASAPRVVPSLMAGP